MSPAVANYIAEATLMQLSTTSSMLLSKLILLSDC